MKNSSLSKGFTDIHTVIVANDHGDVRIRCNSTDGAAQVNVEAVKAVVDMEAVDMKVNDGTLTVDVPGMLDRETGKGFSFKLGSLSLSSGTSKVDVELELPVGVTLKATTKYGDIGISGTAGDVRARTGSGDIGVEAAEEIALATGSGDIVVGTCRGGSLATGSGDIELRESLGSSVECRSGSGDLHAWISQGSFDGKTGSGDITVTIPRGIPVWLDLSTGTGRVAKDLESVGEPAEGQQAMAVKAKSGTGDIRVCH